MRDLFADLRYAWRQLRRTPAFTALAVLTLALGIATSTVFFGLANALALKPVPGVNLDGVYASGGSVVERFRRLEEAPPASVRAAAAHRSWVAVVHVPGRAQRLNVGVVSAGYPLVLGLGTEAGRWFTRDEERGAAHVAVVSDRLWRDWFGADPEIVGRSTIRLHARAHLTIVGVATRGFRGPYPGYAQTTDVWLPLGTMQALQLEFVPAERRARATATFPVSTLVKAADGASPVQLTSDLQPILRVPIPPGSPARPTEARQVTAAIDEMLPTTVSRFAMTILVLATLVLVAACANLANMLYARGAGRAGEVAVRLSLGASRRRVMRLFLAETAVITGLSALVGFALAVIGLTAAGLTLSGLQLPEIRWTTLALTPSADGRVLLFAVLAATVAAACVGLLTAWRSSRVEPQRAFGASSAQTTVGARDGWLRTVLVSIQITAAVLLVMGAGTALESTLPQLSRRLHYDTSRVLASQLDLRLHEYTPADGRAFITRVLGAAGAIGDVEAVAVADGVPGGVGGTGARLSPLVAEPPPGGPTGAGRRVYATSTRATPGFLDVIGLRVLRGRDFRANDADAAPLVVIVSEAAAAALWPGDDALGKRLQLGTGPWISVVGIVADPMSSAERYQDYSPAPWATVPFDQWYQPNLLVLARSPRASALSGPLQQAIRGIDDELAIFETATIDQSIVAWAGPRLGAARLLATLGAIALAISTMGVYGVIAYFVSRRTREFGLRLALGATPRSIVKMVYDHAVHIVLVGLLPAVFLAAVGSRILETRVAMIFPNEIRTWVIVPLVILTAGIVAALVPARRAARVDPNVALRDL
ncbi:MAG TPA: ABC transporter permease [Vicinamibacterales bacterium]|nr:ABC transporter permease [Vicinamibacterales bacterium]